MRATVGLAPADERAMASALSGGMKRKLQLGMALIGGSQVRPPGHPTLAILVSAPCLLSLPLGAAFVLQGRAAQRGPASAVCGAQPKP